jgi:DNA-binding PadR family transcriptional regulator
MPAARADHAIPKLTIPDLVLLSLLAERPMHGYQANLLLEFRKVRDWAGVSRPQVYYSLDKLVRLGLIRSMESEEHIAGPERRAFETTARGRAALADALERDDWTQHTERPPFLTWLSLSWQCRPGVFTRQLQQRQKFLESELVRKREVRIAVRKEVGHPFHEAVWILSLNIDLIRAELLWLKKIGRQVPRRSAARNPAYLSKGFAGPRP